jgi:hypothetical protein
MKSEPKEKLMSTVQPNKRLATLALLAIVMLLAVAAVLLPGNQADAAKPARTITVEVAQDMASAVLGAGPFHEDGMPAGGNTFIVEGFIYPEGTLDGTNGVIVSVDEEGNPVVEPEFPDLVIGRWICRGWFLADGMYTQDEPWAISTQLFELDGQFGEVTIVSEGYELPDGMEDNLYRAITGGTGPYASARGEQIQRFMGLNASQGTNFHIQLNLEKK